MTALPASLIVTSTSQLRNKLYVAVQQVKRIAGSTIHVSHQQPTSVPLRMAAPVEHFPDKQQGIPLEDPLQFFPLTRDNIRQNLPKVLRQLLSYDLQGQRKFEQLTHAIYTRDAVFQYPLALLRGREAICQFWNGFLAGVL